MDHQKQKWDHTPFPDFIRSLPEIDISLPGVRGWLLQGRDQQLVFLDIQPVGRIPEHSHGEQWGVVICGRMELTIAGQSNTYEPGDWYHIPADTPHSANFLERFAAIDFFADRNRYQAKK